MAKKAKKGNENDSTKAEDENPKPVQNEDSTTLQNKEKIIAQKTKSVTSFISKIVAIIAKDEYDYSIALE